MDMRHLRKSTGCRLFYAYLKCLEKTVKLNWEGADCFQGHHVVGFWHEDSFAMNLVLRKIAGQGEQVDVLVTADGRGEYIQYLIEKCGGKAVRLGYGFCDAGTFRGLLKDMENENTSLAIAMDGPLGPRHVPKRTTYFLAEKSGAQFLGVTIFYSKKIRLTRRWDHYRIPLPFSTVTVRLDNYGGVSLKEPPLLKNYEDRRRGV